MNNHTIPTLSPSVFKKTLISTYDQYYLDKEYFNDFFIHDLSKQAYDLKLPLPPHRKTVNDIVFLTEGAMIKSSGVDQFKVETQSLFLLPAGQITTTKEISKDIKGYYLHFSDHYLLLNNIDLSTWITKPIVPVTQTEATKLAYLRISVAPKYALTKKTLPYSLEERNRKLNEVIRGWVNNFRLGSMYTKLKKLDEWLRNRLRYCIWHDWKKLERKRKNLIQLGIEQGQAYAWSRTRMGGWAVAQSPILRTTITQVRLKRRGYESMIDYYQKVKV